MTELKELRIKKEMTQQQVAEMLGVSLRSYKSYENDECKSHTLKYKYMLEQLMKINVIDEEHGILTIESIQRKCTTILEQYNVKYCYLFGSYAKGKATSTSDVDLLISTDTKGLKFFGMVEDIRQALCKNVDVLDIKQLKDNIELTEEILKDGIKIYG